MAKVEWIKILTGMFDDEKIKLIEDTPEADMVLIIWIKLLTLAGKKNQAGYIFLTEKIPYTDEMLSTIFKRPLNTIRLALSTFRKLEMIDLDKAGIIKITNWEKHQNIEGMERIRELGRKRVQKFRAKNKELPEPKGKSNVTETESNALDKIRVDKIRKEKEIKEVRNQVSASLKEKSISKEKKPANNIEFDQELLSWHGIDEDIIDDWVRRFPNIDVPVELMKIREFFKNNPGKAKIIEKKFEGRMPIYINDWLERAVKYKIADSLK